MTGQSPAGTALVLVDLMPRIIAQPTAPHSGEEVLRRCLDLAAGGRAAGGLVVFVRGGAPGRGAPAARQ